MEDVESVESRVVFTIILERNSGYYMTNVIVPVILLGTFNVFTFVLPADSGEKIGYTMTVFLSFAVFLTVVSSELPQTSGSILEYYLLFQLVMGTFIIVTTLDSTDSTSSEADVDTTLHIPFASKL
jgi:hypothetical protein